MSERATPETDKANAETVLETALDLIRQVLVKHETAVIAEFRVVVEAKKHELKLIYAERDEAREALREATDLLDESSSPYIDACGEDIKWCSRRNEIVSRARALLAKGAKP